MKWKNGKRWVYSITYDEGCALLLEHALPVHRKYGVPGHVALLASQIGVPRNVPGNDYHGMMILSKSHSPGQGLHAGGACPTFRNRLSGRR